MLNSSYAPSGLAGPVTYIAAVTKIDILHIERGFVDRWFARHVTVTVDCSDMASSFANVNDPEQRAAIEKQIMRSG